MARATPLHGSHLGTLEMGGHGNEPIKNRSVLSLSKYPICFPKNFGLDHSNPTQDFNDRKSLKRTYEGIFGREHGYWSSPVQPTTPDRPEFLPFRRSEKLRPSPGKATGIYIDK